ncbi:hypothetical protein WDW86_08650 [Bdellovibrionota bacterium FG-2]
MNIRLDGRSVRFRLSEKEFVSLREGTAISEKVPFPGGKPFRFSVGVGGKTNLVLDNSSVIAWVTGRDVEALAAELLSSASKASGVHFEVLGSDGKQLKISVQVDLSKQST